MSGDRCTPPQGRPAASVALGHCSHGFVWIELLDEHGKPFAVASFDVARAVAMAKGLMDLVEPMLPGQAPPRAARFHRDGPLMPIRPEDRRRYPPDWPAISLEVRRDRAGWACEGSPAFPDCRARNGEPHPVTGSIVVLTVAHLDHTPENNGSPGDRPNLRALCQRCHNVYDQPKRLAGIRARARAADGTDDLFAGAAR